MKEKFNSQETLTWIRKQLLILASSMVLASLMLFYLGISSLPMMRRFDRFLLDSELSVQVHTFVENLIKAVKVCVFFFGFGIGGILITIAIYLFYMRHKVAGIETKNESVL